MESLLFIRLVCATTIGIITALFLDWNFFFVFVAGYSAFESVVLFIIVKRTELKIELEYEGKILTSAQRMQISSRLSRYACAYATIALCLSFGMISFFGALAKWIVELFFG